MIILTDIKRVKIGKNNAITYIFIYHNTPKTYWKNVQGKSENQLKTKEKP